MAGQLKIGGNVIATHAGSEGSGTVTLDSSTLTIGSNTTFTGNSTGTFNGSIGNSATLNLVTHFRPVDNFGHDTVNTDLTLTLSNNKTYIAFCNGFAYSGAYTYFRAMLFTVNGSGVVTTHLNENNVDPNIPALKSTGTNTITISSNHSGYRLTGVLFEMT